MSSDIRKRKIFILCFFTWLLVASWMVMIFILSNQPASESAKLSSAFLQKIIELLNIIISTHTIRKAAHAFEYFMLGIFVFIASRFTWNKPKPYFTFLFSVLYSATDEIHQHFIPGRACRFSDICIDSAGAAAGIILCLLTVYVFNVLKRRKKRCVEKLTK